MSELVLDKLDRECDRLNATWMLKRNCVTDEINNGTYQILVFSRDREGRKGTEYYGATGSQLELLTMACVEVLEEYK